MSYLEKRTVNEKKYIYYTKKISILKKKYTIKKNIGTSLNISKEKFILDNIEYITKKELKYRLNFLKLIENNISYDLNLPKQIEEKAILINNLLDGKNCKEIIDIEFAKEFIFNSNNIEGSKISPEKVKEIIEKGDTKYFERNEVKEVKNSIIALEYIRNNFKFNVSSIKRLYYILTKNLVRDGNLSYPKGFKKEKIVVGNSNTTDPEKVDEELKDLLKWYTSNSKKIHPFILAFEFHKKYEKIHPFTDANGRTGRMIMNKILINSNYYPIIIYKENKIAYFNALEKSEKLKNYYQFMLEQMNKSYDFILETIKKY